MSLWLAIAVQAGQAGPTVSTFDLAASAKPLAPAITARCHDEGSRDEVIVCGQIRDRYRLPLPSEREPPARVREAQTGMAALTPSGACGIFAGERRCTKKEAADYGYGNGRDPITLLTRLAGKAIDPDAD